MPLLFKKSKWNLAAFQIIFGDFRNLIINSWEEEADVPAQSDLSELISKDLKKRGFNFLRAGDYVFIYASNRYG